LQFPTAAGVGGQLRISVTDWPPRKHGAVALGFYRTDDEITRFPADNPVPNPEVKVDGEFSTVVYLPVLGHHSGPPTTKLVNGLQDLLNWVRTQALPLFREFFS
jgi:hypothetical protein